MFLVDIELVGVSHRRSIAVRCLIQRWRVVAPPYASLLVALEILDAISVGGGGGAFNEDAFGWTENSLWVVDGSTPLDCTGDWEQTSARWIAAETNKLLSKASGSIAVLETVKRLSSALSDRWDRVLADRDTDGILPPVGSLGLVMSLPGRAVECVTLGDCSIVRQPNGASPTEVFNDFDTAHTETRRVAEMSQGGALDIKELIRDRLGYVNGKGGCVLSVNPEIVDHVTTRVIADAGGDLILVVSDGFARTVHLPRFGGSWDAVINTAMTEGLSRLLLSLREWETNDPSFTRGEHKTSDDATALLARVSAN